MIGGDDRVKTKVWMLSLTFPHVFVVGGDDWAGVQVWDITPGMRSKPLFNIHHNGRSSLFLSTIQILLGEDRQIQNWM